MSAPRRTVTIDRLVLPASWRGDARALAEAVRAEVACALDDVRDVRDVRGATDVDALRVRDGALRSGPGGAAPAPGAVARVVARAIIQAVRGTAGGTDG